MSSRIAINSNGTGVFTNVKLGWHIELKDSDMRRIRSTAEPKTYDKIVREAIVIGLRIVAKLTGYVTVEEGMEAIAHDLSKLYPTPQKLGEWVAVHAYGRKDYPVWDALAAGDMKPYRKYMKNRNRPALQYVQDIDPAEVRKGHKRKVATRRIKGFVTAARQKRYVKAEADRIGVIAGGTFWAAAREINPKARPDGMARHKTKSQRKTKRSESYTQNVAMSTYEVLAEVVASHENMRDVNDIDNLVRRAAAKAQEYLDKETVIKGLQEARKRATT